ncbi:MAG: alpha/beta fold hydrolase [Actinomycetota bacterium]
MSESGLPHTRLGTGAPLVVFPGLFGRRGVPAPFVRWMQRSEIIELAVDREVWSIDRRFGLEHGITFGILAAEHAEAIRQRFDGPVDIVGISTGGSIALQLAADFPELVRRLVLVSSAYRLSDVGREAQRQIAGFLRQNRSRSAAARFLGDTGATPLTRAFLALAGRIAPRLVVGHRDPDLLVLLEAEDGFDLGGRMASIRVPTLIVGGGRDRFYTPELFEVTGARMPNASVKIYPSAGHISTFGNRKLAREILGFFAQQ